MLFAHQGSIVAYTTSTGDFGADLILKRGKDVILVQAKRYKSTVGITAVQEVIPAVKMYHAINAWVISNSYYTKATITLAEYNHVLLIEKRPGTIGELQAVKGFGEKRIAGFGDELVKIIKG